MSDRPDLDALERLADSATPGPWKNGYDPSHYGTSEVSDGKTFAYYVPDENDARFIAAARTALPALTAYVRRVEVERDEAQHVQTRAIDHALKMHNEHLGRVAKEYAAAAEKATANRIIAFAEAWNSDDTHGLVDELKAGAWRGKETP